MTIQNDLQNKTSQHGGRRRLDNAVVDMMIKHITDQVQDQLEEYQNVLDNKSYEAKEVVDDTKNKVEKFLRDEWEELVNVLTAGDDAQKYIDEKMSAGKDALDSAMQALKEKVTAADKALEKLENDVSNLVTRDLPEMIGKLTWGAI